MIKITKGTYGLMVDGSLEAMTQNSAPFSLSDEREAELVASGVAEYVAEPEDETQSKYNGMKMIELRKAAEALNVDVSTIKSKREVIAMLEAAELAAEAETEAADGGKE